MALPHPPVPAPTSDYILPVPDPELVGFPTHLFAAHHPTIPDNTCSASEFHVIAVAVGRTYFAAFSLMVVSQ
jgi:hypothetical protein